MGGLYLALSCLQGRPMRQAFDALATLGVGVQLTPGNEPTPDFARHVAASGVPTRTHHGFSFERRAGKVWSDEGACVASSDSVHPPRHDSPAAEHFSRWLEANPQARVLETMYPGYCLGSGDALEQALTRSVPLAVDVSHLFIQRTAGVLTDGTLRRVLDSPHVVEVHVSQNDGRHDSHRPLRRDSFELGWARERLSSGLPVIYEAYLHLLSDDARRAQLDLVRQALT
ncbi:MAG: hypothetical protein SFW67_12505 [Myxococcaceae bacterium]|nr:hypothetical protein [Myxococcaceae bacterium]